MAQRELRKNTTIGTLYVALLVGLFIRFDASDALIYGAVAGVFFELADSLCMRFRPYE